MSQIHVQGRYLEQPVDVVMGWDRITQQCFLAINLTAEQVQMPDWEPLVLLSLELQMTGATPTVESVRAALHRGEVEVSPKALALLAQHYLADEGNSIVTVPA